MLSKPKNTDLKYHIVVEWPPSCRNRNVKTLRNRPDLVYRLNEHTKKCMELAKTYSNVKIESEYNFVGIRMWFRSGKDVYDFILNQNKNEIKVIPELYVVNGLNNRLDKFLFQVDGSNIIVY
jgi:hypothetical protein